MRRKTLAITPSNMRVLHAVSVIYLERGYVTHEMLIDALGLTRSTIHEHLSALRKMGLVTWERGKMGTIRPATVS